MFIFNNIWQPGVKVAHFYEFRNHLKFAHKMKVGGYKQQFGKFQVRCNWNWIDKSLSVRLWKYPYDRVYVCIYVPMSVFYILKIGKKEKWTNNTK